ncbi:MAG: hypothetical protein JRN20_16235 [Nitrososphaerota archaeon]|nr:hypothetical protein [Nitrososphaerota archaeon]
MKNNHTLLILKKKAGISPIVATIILIAITVAAGLVVYGIMNGVIGTASNNTQISVIQATLVQTSGSSGSSFSMTVKNSGSQPLNSVTVSVPSLGLSTSLKTLTITPSGALSPGESVSVTSGGPNAAACTVGDTYAVQINATASNGGSYATSTSVTCTTS